MTDYVCFPSGIDTGLTCIGRRGMVAESALERLPSPGGRGDPDRPDERDEGLGEGEHAGLREAPSDGERWEPSDDEDDGLDDAGAP